MSRLDSRFVSRQSVTTVGWPASRAHDEDRLAQCAARAEAARLRQHGGEPEEPGVRRPDDAVVLGRHLDRAADRRADDAPVVLGDERRVRRVVEAFLPLVRGALEGRAAAASRRPASGPGARGARRRAGRAPDVAAFGPADGDPGRWRGASRPAAGASRIAWTCCMAEPEPEPGVDEGRVRGRDDGVVARRAGARPSGPRRARTGRGRPPGSVTAWPAPSTHMFGPHSAAARRADEVADDRPAAQGDRAAAPSLAASASISARVAATSSNAARAPARRAAGRDAGRPGAAQRHRRPRGRTAGSRGGPPLGHTAAPRTTSRRASPGARQGHRRARRGRPVGRPRSGRGR